MDNPRSLPVAGRPLLALLGREVSHGLDLALDVALHLGHRAMWPVASQHASRRNAMLAATEIRHRRREQDEVEAFLAAHRFRRTSATG
jgi:hypothetical protein